MKIALDARYPKLDAKVHPSAPDAKTGRHDERLASQVDSSGGEEDIDGAFDGGRSQRTPEIGRRAHDHDAGGEER